MSETTPQHVIDYFGQEIKRRRFTFTKPEEDLEYEGFRLTITSEPSVPVELLDTDRPFVAQIVSSDRAFPFCFFRYEDIFGNKRGLGKEQIEKISAFVREQSNTIEKQFIAWIHEQEVDPKLFRALSCRKLIFAIDGINGSGKTTCLNAIRTFLIEKGIRPIVPILDLVGTGELGQAYKRDLMLGENRHFTGKLDKLLAQVACLDTVKNYVPKALETSNIVAISRWSGSYFVYQEVLGAGNDPQELTSTFKHHHRLLESICHPSFCIYCDPGKHNVERIQERGKGSDLHEQLESQEEIREKSLIAFQMVNDHIDYNGGRVIALDTSCDKLEMMKRAVSLFIQEVKRAWKDPQSELELVDNVVPEDSREVMTTVVDPARVKLLFEGITKDTTGAYARPNESGESQPEDKNALAVKIAEKACEELKKLLLDKKES